MTKVCKTCNEEKELEAYYKHKKMKYGRQSQCKDCMKVKYQQIKAREVKANEERWNGYMGADYAEARQCVQCKEVKHWTKFCLGADHLVNLCRVCHRARLKDLALSPAVPHHSKKQSVKNMNDLLKFLDRVCS